MCNYGFFDAAQYQSYAAGSIVRTARGTPCIIHSIHIRRNGNLYASYYPLSKGGYYRGLFDGEDYNEMDTDLNGAGFDFSPIPLGYFDAMENRTFIAARNPSRQWKIGITKKNTFVTHTVHNPDQYLGMPRYPFEEQGFKDLISGKKVEIRDVIDKVVLAKKFTQARLSRKWMIDSDDNLYYYLKDDPVGTWKKGFELSPKFFYLQQELDILLNGL